MMTIVYTFKKHFKSIIIFSIIILLFSTLIFKLTYPTQYPFKDSEIIGANRDEIIAIYGNPLGSSDTRIYYDGVKKPYSLATRAVMRNNEVTSESVHYFICFNENDLAYKVEIGLNLGG